MATYRIYIAEDQPMQADLLRTILQQNPDYQVTFFNDGLKLFQHVQEAPPNLLVLDIIMPSLSGLAIARLLKFHEDYRHIPILVLSSIIDHDIEERSKKAGADVFLSKPLEINTFMDQVAALLAGQDDSVVPKA